MLKSVQNSEESAAITQLGYLGIGVSDLQRWKKFACDILGLQENGISADGGMFLRLDSYHHRFEILPTGEDDIIFIGFEVKDAHSLANIAARVRAYGIDVHEGAPEDLIRRKVLGLIRFEDPDGLTTEIYYGPLIDHQPFISPRGVGGFNADSLGLGHVVRLVEDPELMNEFYMSILGAKLSDVIEFTMGGTKLGVKFLHVNPRHHTAAFAPMPPAKSGATKPKRLEHFMVETKNIDDVGLALALCSKNDVSAGTLGRHTNDKMLSFYSVTPSGFRVEYGSDGLQILDEDKWEVQYHHAASIWGHEMPRSS